MIGDTGFTDHRPHNLVGYVVVPKGYNHTIEQIHCAIKWINWMRFDKGEYSNIQERMISILKMMENASNLEEMGEIETLTSFLMWDTVSCIQEYAETIGLEVGWRDGNLMIDYSFEEEDNE